MKAIYGLSSIDPEDAETFEKLRVHWQTLFRAESTLNKKRLLEFKPDCDHSGSRWKMRMFEKYLDPDFLSVRKFSPHELGIKNSEIFHYFLFFNVFFFLIKKKKKNGKNKIN